MDRAGEVADGETMGTKFFFATEETMGIEPPENWAPTIAFT